MRAWKTSRRFTRHSILVGLNRQAKLKYMQKEREKESKIIVQPRERTRHTIEGSYKNKMMKRSLWIFCRIKKIYIHIYDKWTVFPRLVPCRDWYRVFIDFWFRFCYWSAVYEAFFLSLYLAGFKFFPTLFKYASFLLFSRLTLSFTHTIAYCSVHYKIRRKNVFTVEIVDDLFYILLFVFVWLSHILFIFIYFHLVKLQL